MRRRTQFVLMLIAVNFFDSWLPLSARAAEHVRCEVAVFSKQKVLKELAQLQVQIESADPKDALTAALKRAYRVKLEDARKLHIDLKDLSAQSDLARGTQGKENKKRSDGRKAIDELENKAFSWPRISFQLPEGEYTKKSQLFWNRYAAIWRAGGIGQDDSIVIWDTQSAKILKVFDDQASQALTGGYISNVSVSADGQWVLLSSFRKTVLYDMSRNEKSLEFEDASRAEFSSDGSKILLSNKAGAHVWSLSKSAAKIEKHFVLTAGVQDAHFSLDGSRMVGFRDVDKQIDIWDLSTRSRSGRKILIPEGRRILTSTLSRDGLYVAVKIGAHGTEPITKIYKTEDGLSVSEIGVDRLLEFQFSFDENLLMTTDASNEVAVWDVKSGAKIFDVVAPQANPQLSFDNRFLVASKSDGYIVYDVHNSRIVAQDNSGAKRSLRIRGGRRSTASDSHVSRWVSDSGEDRMMKRVRFIILAVISVFATSARAADSRACSAVLIDLANLQGQIENNQTTDPVLHSFLKRAYRAKLEEARKQQVDLTTLGALSDETHNEQEQKSKAQDERRRSAEEAEKATFNWPNTSVNWVQSDYRHNDVFWNRYSLSWDKQTKTLILWDLESAKILKKFDEQSAKKLDFAYSAITKITVSPDGRKMLFHTLLGGRTALYDIESDQVKFRFDDVGFRQFSADGSKVILDTQDGVQVWDITKSKPKKILHEGRGEESTGHISSDGLQLISFQRSKEQIGVWDLATGIKIREIQLPVTGSVAGQSWSADGRYLGIKSSYRTLSIYDTTNGDLVRRLDVKGELKFTFSADSRSLVTLNKPKEIIVWDLRTGEEKLKISAPHNNWRLSPDGRFLAVTNDDGFVVYDVNNKSTLISNDSAARSSIEFTLIKGHLYLVIASNDGLITPELIE